MAAMTSQPSAYPMDFTAQFPMKRLPTPSDYVPTVVFLASDDSRMITGSNITVDGAPLQSIGRGGLSRTDQTNSTEQGENVCAAIIAELGAAPVLGERPEPITGKDGVLVHSSRA
ncbi:hypothetical protein GCM10020255_008360 [Rhodococcus baikonurensis]